jgi:hypothetical protein
MNVLESMTWIGNWAWGVPFIVVNVLMHVAGLNLIGRFVLGDYASALRKRAPAFDFVGVVATTALLMISLHAIEAATWAGAYLLLGALGDRKTAMLYSVGAMTTYGHASLYLKPEWQLLGTIEALDGMLLFGLTTAFMFSIFQAIGSLEKHHINWSNRNRMEAAESP